MNELGWVFIGAFAALSTFMTLRTSDNTVAIISGISGTFAWLLFGFYALQITYYSGGSSFTQSYPAMAVLGVMMAAPNFYVALTGPLDLVTDEPELRSEVT
jgi:hypothetical protein